MLVSALNTDRVRNLNLWHTKKQKKQLQVKPMVAKKPSQIQAQK